MNVKSISNLFVRSLTILSKFAFSLTAIKYLSLQEFGEYGIILTTVSLGAIVIGFDFYSFNIRKMLSFPLIERGEFLINQLLFHAVSYIVIAPIFVLFFLLNVIDSAYIYFFYILLVTEHLSWEIYRVFIAFEKPIFANFLLFIRLGLWIIVIVFLWSIGMKQYQRLDSVMLFWTMASIASVALGVMILARLKIRWQITNLRSSMKAVLEGIKISVPFFIGTLSYKVIEFSNRYIIDFYKGKEELGVFLFYIGISNTIQVVVHSMVVMLYSPQLISLHSSGDATKYDQVRKRFFRDVLYSTVFFILIAAVGINFLLKYLDRVELYETTGVFYLLLISVGILNMSLVPHNHLYVNMKDQAILKTTLVGGGINILLNFILINIFGLWGAAVSLFLSYCVVFVLKFKMSSKI